MPLGGGWMRGVKKNPRDGLQAAAGGLPSRLREGIEGRACRREERWRQPLPHPLPQAGGEKSTAAPVDTGVMERQNRARIERDRLEPAVRSERKA
jgi:hypothetical protein